MDAVEIKESRADVALLVATLICIASSSSIAHEYASRFLDMTVRLAPFSISGRFHARRTPSALPWASEPQHS